MKSEMRNTKYEWAAVLGFLALAAAVIFNTPSAQGELTARVYPGYVFQSGQRVTVEQLNRLGTPTIVIVGTLDGTNVGLSAGSVNGTMLSADVVDNVTTSFTNASIRVNPRGIRNLQIYTNMFDTLSAIDPGGTTIRWNPDWHFLVISNNQATIDTNFVIAAVAAGINLDTVTYSNQTAVPAAASAQSLNHGMGTAPSWWRVTMVNTSANLNYAAGDEVELSSFFAFGQFSSDERVGPAFTVFTDPAATPSIVVRRHASTFGSISLTLYGVNKTTGAFEAVDTSKWNLRFRVRR